MVIIVYEKIRNKCQIFLYFTDVLNIFLVYLSKSVHFRPFAFFIWLIFTNFHCDSAAEFWVAIHSKCISKSAKKTDGPHEWYSTNYKDVEFWLSLIMLFLRVLHNFFMLQNFCYQPIVIKKFYKLIFFKKLFSHKKIPICKFSIYS